jgi:hypothetical protein
MPLNQRGTAAAILSLVTVSGAETAFAQKPGGILRVYHWDSPVGTVNCRCARLAWRSGRQNWASRDAVLGRRRSRRLDRGRDDGALDGPLLLPGSGRPARQQIIGRDERDIAKMHGIERPEYLRLAWADPAKGEADYTALPETELEAIVRAREAVALYGWKPYVHNPRLKRWLHRDARGALLWTSGTTRSVSDTANPGNIRP